MVATYELQGEFPLEECARVVAMEESTGTWTPVPKRTGSLEDRVAAWVESVDEEAGTARVAYPYEIFEPENIPGFLAIVAGNLFGLGSLSRCRLVDLEFPDVRLVYAPPRAVGAYGGEVDNWSWPRHVGDFALLRVYAGPDGQPAPKGDANVPYQPRHFFPVSPRGIEPGGFVMVA